MIRVLNVDLVNVKEETGTERRQETAALVGLEHLRRHFKLRQKKRVYLEIYDGSVNSFVMRLHPKRLHLRFFNVSSLNT